MKSLKDKEFKSLEENCKLFFSEDVKQAVLEFEKFLILPSEFENFQEANTIHQKLEEIFNTLRTKHKEIFGDFER